jgi:hypothetical protein
MHIEMAALARAATTCTLPPASAQRMCAPGIGLGAIRATAAPLILERAGPHNNRLQLRLQLQQAPSLHAPRSSSSSSSSPRPRPSPTAHRSTGGHRGQQTPQSAPAAAATATTAPIDHVMGLRPPLLLPTLLTQPLGACIYISTTSNTANANKYSSGRGRGA